MKVDFVFLGVGGLGTNLAVAIAHFGKNWKINAGNSYNKNEIAIETNRLVFMDPDIVEESNLNRLPLKAHVGEPKTYALKDFIEKNVNNDLVIVPYVGDARVGLDNVIKLYKEEKTKDHKIVIFDTTDRTLVQKDLITKYRKLLLKPGAKASKNSVFIHVSNENEFVCVEVNSLHAERLEKHHTGYLATPTNSFYVSGTLALAYAEIRKQLILLSSKQLPQIKEESYNLHEIQECSFTKAAIRFAGGTNVQEREIEN